jgi:16S rRNA (guanine527-N7)-methyltransferase
MAQTGVSRETLDRFVAYADLLTKWQERINLVGRSTLDDLWRRHFLDSAQVHSLLPPGTQTVLDLGSGAGFPGLVLALMGIPHVHLAESDNRKCAFLREAARVCGVTVTVHARRIETIPPFEADVITARALAPVDMLLGYAAPFMAVKTHCLFLKGQNAQAELDVAARQWQFRVSRIPSCTDPDATLLDLQEVCRHD